MSPATHMSVLGVTGRARCTLRVAGTRSLSPISPLGSAPAATDTGARAKSGKGLDHRGKHPARSATIARWTIIARPTCVVHPCSGNHPYQPLATGPVAR